MLSSFSSDFYGIAISPSNPFTPAPPFLDQIELCFQSHQPSIHVHVSIPRPAHLPFL